MPSIGFAQKLSLSPYVDGAQLLNLSNTYASASNDTSGPGTLYLTSAMYSTTTALPVKSQVIGSGTISFIASVLKAQITTTTTNAVVAITPQASFDGVNWASIPGVTVATLTPTSATVATTTMFEFSANYAPYYRLKNSITVDTASIKEWYLLNKATSNLK